MKVIIKRPKRLRPKEYRQICKELQREASRFQEMNIVMEARLLELNSLLIDARETVKNLSEVKDLGMNILKAEKLIRGGEVTVDRSGLPQPKKSPKRPFYTDKRCKRCLKMFTPTGPRSEICPNCKAEGLKAEITTGSEEESIAFIEDPKPDPKPEKPKEPENQVEKFKAKQAKTKAKRDNKPENKVNPIPPNYENRPHDRNRGSF